jgi:hypothetical protein
MRIIKVHRARCRIHRNDRGMSLSPRAPKEEKRSKIVHALIERRQRKRSATKAKKKKPSEEASNQQDATKRMQKWNALITVMRGCMTSKDHPRRRSKATGQISGGVLASIQGGRAQISTKTPGINYEGTACSAMDAGEIELPVFSKMPNAVPTSWLLWPVSNHTRRVSLW